jgi:hypothetical protein
MDSKKIIEDFNRSHNYGSAKDCFFVEQLRTGGLTDEQIAVTLNVVDNTCHECWNAEAGCQCWNDE